MITPIVVYTHTDYSDVLNIFNRSIKRYNIPETAITYISNKQVAGGYNTITYNDSLPYASRLLSCLSDIKTDTFIFLHEDFILYDVPDFRKIEYLNFFLRANPEYPFIRLIKTDEKNSILGPENRLFLTSNYFAIQATIFYKDYLQKYLAKYPSLSIWDLESVRNDNPNKGLYYFNNEPKRGAAHYDSSIFPYMATAIVKGKWNTEYKKELLQLEDEKYFSYRGWT